MAPDAQGFRFSLRDLEHFPILELLPKDNDPSGTVDLAYYEDPGDEPDGISDPIKHWCLLVEVVYHTASEKEMVYNVNDREGKNFFVVFHRDTEKPTPEPWQKYCRGGNVMAIMYACSHEFPEGSLGVQVTESENVKSFPCSLETFLLLGDELDEPCTKKCSACEDPGPHKCARCSVRQYCGKDCQTNDWKARHKNECAAFRQLTPWRERDWKTFDEYWIE